MGGDLHRRAPRTRRALRRPAALFGVVLATLALSACTELRGRRRIREGNRLYREGHYQQALEQFAQAEGLVPHLPLLWLNKGLTCRHLTIPGARTAESERAAACAIASFEHFSQLRPQDPRGEQLVVQALFDAERFETLAARYGERVRKNPADIAAINGLISVYTRWNRGDEALQWYRRRADLQPRDADAQYSVGVFIWQQLFQRGGDAEKASFDPRPDARAGKLRASKTPPLFQPGDITGQQRIALADLGITYLQRALALRPKYREALVYLNLVHRQKAMAFFAEPDRWQSIVEEAERWRKQATEGAAAPL